MLFLKRKKDDILTIEIPDSIEKITIKILKIDKTQTLIGIDTPTGYKVLRGEAQLKTLICNNSQ